MVYHFTYNTKGTSVQPNTALVADSIGEVEVIGEVFVECFTMAGFAKQRETDSIFQVRQMERQQEEGL